MRKLLIPGLAIYSLLSGAGLFLGSGASSPLLIPWLAGYLFLVFVVSYLFLFIKEQSNGFLSLILGIIGLNFLVQLTGGPGSPLWPAYFLLAAAATFQPVLRAYQAVGLILFIEAANLLASGQWTHGRWPSYAGFALSLVGVVFIITPMTGRIRKQVRVARERYQKLIEGANAVDPLADGMRIDALTEKGRQAANVSVAVEREGAFKGLMDMISGIVPAHTYALFIDDRGDGVFTLRGIRSQSRYAASGNVRVARGSGLIGISADKNQPQYLPHMVIPAKSLGYYMQEVPVKSFLAVPITMGDRVVGVLAVDSLESEAFSPETQEMFTRFAPFFSQIIEKIRISMEMDMRAKNFAALHEMSSILNSSLELGDILDKLTLQIRSVVPYDFCAFCLYDEKSKEAVLSALHGYESRFTGSRFPVSESAILSLMFKQWRDQGVSRTYHDPDLGARGREIGLFPFRELQKPLQTLYGRPLVARGKFIGAFFLGSVRADAFSEYQRNFIDTLMNQASMVVGNTVLHESIRDMARTDGLTGLLNHRTFMEKLREEYKRLDRDSRPFSILLIDIDHFKKVNDTHGHPVGDTVLTHIARVLKETVRGADFVARYGGEEFAVAMVVDADSHGAEHLAERIRKIVEKTAIAAGNAEIRVTLSIGVATFPDDTRKPEELVTLADETLYHAKRSGRNRVSVYKAARGLRTAPAGTGSHR